MTTTTLEFAPGLEHIIATETSLSRVDGQKGELIIAGFPVEELAQNLSFEALIYTLWHGDTPDDEARESTRAALARGRQRAFGALTDFASPDALPKDPMSALRALLASADIEGATFAHALELAAYVPVAIATWWARTHGGAPLEPDLRASHAADYLRMLTGEPPTDAQARALDNYLICVSDHGTNASTFTARVIASTRADMTSAVVGALGALKGPLHGGAPGPVLDMLDAIGEPERAAAWLTGELEAGRRIMGMGHRVYRVRDPRAAVFEATLLDVTASDGANRRVELARAVEASATELLARKYPARALRANVEFYTAVLLEALSIPRALFSATFAVGRVAGWLAHINEQYKEGKLIRPRSRYVGPLR